MSNSHRRTTVKSQKISNPNKESVVAAFKIDRRTNRQLEKMASAGGMSKSKLALFFLEKRCITPANP